MKIDCFKVITNTVQGDKIYNRIVIALICILLFTTPVSNL